MSDFSVTLLTTLAGLRSFLDIHCLPDKTLGFVPTMGALHPGHQSLIRQARQANQVVIVSIFVNPLQFAPGEDLAQYPRSLEQDQAVCQALGVDAIFAPSVEMLFPQGLEQGTRVVPPAAMTAGLCGRSRPGHFQGVATIVARLLHLVGPQQVYFGQKDAQQLAILRRMVADLDFPVQLQACPIVREANGLAYSSRNQYLNPSQKQQAAALYRSLHQAERLFRAGQRTGKALIDLVESELRTVPELELDYIELVDPLTLIPLPQVESQGLLAIAVRLGTTRLIDNILLDARRPILAIDGPAGAGKSTVTRLCAQSLGLLYLDTGAMYRAITWRVLQLGIDPQDPVAIAEMVSQTKIELLPALDPQVGLEVKVEGQEVTAAIRSLEVTAKVSEIAAQPAVRHALVQQQKAYGCLGGVAMEGRDIGTNVFPEAGLKIFLTASVRERANRRQLQLHHQGITEIELPQIEQEIIERDHRDSQRTHAPLCKAADAVEIITDGLSISEVKDQIVQLYQSRFSPTEMNEINNEINKQ
jgi:pantoate ligase / CMP/dCMP kinase